jgi:hypothetical protein
MKSFKVLFLVIVSGMIISLSGCKKPNPTPPTVEEVQLEKLKQTWKVKTVTLDGQSKTADYTAFTLVISGTSGSSSFSYAVTGRPATSPWPASGQWTYGTDPTADIVRDPASTADKLDMKYTVTDTQLTFGFTFNGAGYNARTSVVKGAWVFTFDKN